MKKSKHEFLFLLTLFTLVSVWTNRVHLGYALTHGTWWYLGFYATMYLLSVLIISGLAWVLHRVEHKKRQIS